MVQTIIKAKEDMHNGGRCFTKGQTYIVEDWNKIDHESSLMEKRTTNDNGETHIIGSWWRKFKIVKK